MKIYENGNNWVIEDQLDKKIVEKINNLIDENLNGILKLKEGYSTTGKNVEQHWLTKIKEFYFKNEDFENIKSEYKSQILNRFKKSNVPDKKIQNSIDIKTTNCWSVIGEKNSYHIPHHHHHYNVGDGISTVLYLRVPETNIENEPENNLYLILNSNHENIIYYDKPKYITINPTVGKLLIFPDWIIHGTLPQSEGIRQTFNIDYAIVNKNNNILKYN